MILEGIAATVVGGLILAAILGGGALLRRRLARNPIDGDGRWRSDVRFLAKVTDFGDPVPGFITWRVGLLLDVEVHAVRAQPMRITEVGLELLDGTLIPLGTSLRLGQPIAAPDYVEASGYLEEVRKDVAAAGSPVRGFYAKATPARILRRTLPRAWKGFPGVIPQTGLT